MDTERKIVLKKGQCLRICIGDGREMVINKNRNDGQNMSTPKEPRGMNTFINELPGRTRKNLRRRDFAKELDGPDQDESLNDLQFPELSTIIRPRPTTPPQLDRSDLTNESFNTALSTSFVVPSFCEESGQLMMPSPSGAGAKSRNNNNQPTMGTRDPAAIVYRPVLPRLFLNDESFMHSYIDQFGTDDDDQSDSMLDYTFLSEGDDSVFQ